MDMIGFIFVATSPRNVEISEGFIQEVRKVKVNKVGVFVNEDFETIKSRIKDFGLTHVQLHGDEKKEIIDQLKPICKVIKVFSIKDQIEIDFEEYNSSDYFLFDTKGEARGGNGEKFNWGLLDKYGGDIPFLLSGGIQLSDVPEINKITHPNFKGIDINSGFECRPGIKNHDLIIELVNELR